MLKMSDISFDFGYSRNRRRDFERAKEEKEELDERLRGESIDWRAIEGIVNSRYRPSTAGGFRVELRRLKHAGVDVHYSGLDKQALRALYFSKLEELRQRLSKRGTVQV